MMAFLIVVASSTWLTLLLMHFFSLEEAKKNMDELKPKRFRREFEHCNFYEDDDHHSEWFKRMEPVNRVAPNLGWLSTGKIPASLTLGQPTAFRDLMEYIPAERNTIKMYGKTSAVPRFEAVFGKDYTFAGKPHKAIVDFPPPIKELLDYANSIRSFWTTNPSNPKFNGAVVNFYIDESHYIGAHSDSEKGIQEDSPVFSASFGTDRYFKITSKGNNNTQLQLEQPLVLKLADRDICVMGGRMQKNFKHEILKVRKGDWEGPRINITFRQHI